MSRITLNEQIIYLRKQKNITQEELAQVLNVSNQAVSKWESGSCCPDIALLPEIAAYFHVTVDELIGYKSTSSFNDVYLHLKKLFQDAPAEDSFELAYKIAFILHEGAITRGYKGYVPWDSAKIRSTDDEFRHWGFSACSEPEGISVMKGNTVVFASNKQAKPSNSNDIRNIYHALQRFANKDVLTVLFGIYELTVNDFNVFVSLEEIADKCRLTKEIIFKSLDSLPIQTRLLENGSEGYRLEGSFMHLPTILNLLTR